MLSFLLSSRRPAQMLTALLARTGLPSSCSSRSTTAIDGQLPPRMMTAAAPRRAPPAELGRGDITHDFAVDDLEAARLHEAHHRRVHGLAPRRSDGNLLDAEPRQRIDERSRRRGGGFCCGGPPS